MIEIIWTLVPPDMVTAARDAVTGAGAPAWKEMGPARAFANEGHGSQHERAVHKINIAFLAVQNQAAGRAWPARRSQKVTTWPHGVRRGGSSQTVSMHALRGGVSSSGKEGRRVAALLRTL